MPRKKGSSVLLNFLLLCGAILGILCVLSGHKETFLNLSDITKLTPAAYPISENIGLLEPPFDNYQRCCARSPTTTEVEFKKGECCLTKNGVCSRCSYEKKVEMGNYAQTTNNDLYRGKVNNGTTFPSDMNFYCGEQTPAPPKPLPIGNGLRVNKWHSCI